MVSEQGLNVEEVLSLNGLSVQQTNKDDRNKRTNQYFNQHFTFKIKTQSDASIGIMTKEELNLYSYVLFLPKRHRLPKISVRQKWVASLLLVNNAAKIWKTTAVFGGTLFYISNNLGAWNLIR
jgi:hypothetical protein